MKVSLITTVKDARRDVEAFLASVAAQTRPPEEVIVVDGGSTDGTLEILRRAPGITLIEQPGANIARGRNVALAAAAHDVLALTDADCVLEPDWLERLLAPIERGADVSMGTYRPIADGFLQSCMAAVNLPDPAELDESRFLPSGRSVAFRREAIEAVGGWPEWLDIGEDMYVDLRWRELGLDMRLAREAVVHWRLRGSLAGTWAQYFRYARGDAIAGMHPDRNALRFGVYGAALWALGSRRRLPQAATVLGAAARAARPVRRALARLERPGERASALVAVPALMAFTDVAKMAGYAAGLLARSRRALRPEAEASGPQSAARVGSRRRPRGSSRGRSG
ncbi:MAG TPA: glycosyltransferase [Actinomycetota bacterium]|nr:glycosyltransferase [Actinomycetota bacterium]